MNGLATTKPREVKWFKWERNVPALLHWIRSFDDKALEHFCNELDFEDDFLSDENCENLMCISDESNEHRVIDNYIILKTGYGYKAIPPVDFQREYDITL